MPDRELISYSLVDPKTSLDGFDADRARATSGNFRLLPEFEKPTPSGSDASDPAGPGEIALPIPEDGLTPRKRLALSLLLCGSTSSAVAARLGVSVRTIYTWRHEPAFAAALKARSTEAVEACSIRARNLLLKCTLTLNDALNTRERFNWALKMVNANRLWQMSQAMPIEPAAADDEASAATPAQAG